MKIVEESYYTLIFCSLFIYEIKKISDTNNKKTFEFLYLSYWMSKLPNYFNCL